MNPYSTIWLTPKKTFENYFDGGTKRPFFIYPFLVMGISMGLDIAADINEIFKSGFVLSILFALPLGILSALLIFGCILPGALKLSGLLWKGKATMGDMVNVYSISLIPFSLVLLYQVILITVGGNPNENSLSGTLIGIWSFVLLIIGVSKTQGFTYSMAFWNIIIGYSPFIVLGLIRLI